MSSHSHAKREPVTGGLTSAALDVIGPGRIEPWGPPALKIDPWTVLRLARYRRRDLVPPPIWEAARSMAARAEALAAPRALLRTVRVAASGPEGVRLLEGPAFSGRAVGALIAGCPLAVAFILTLGPALEAETASLADRRDLLEAFLLDTAGWAGIEGAVRALRVDLVGRARAKEWRVTHRLGPGHRDWPLEEQQALVELFGDASGLVRLSEHGILLPFKSISGLFGLAPPRGG